MSTEEKLERAFLKYAYESLQLIPDRDLFYEAFGRQFNVSAGWLELDPPRYAQASPPQQDSEEFITADSMDDFKEYDNIPVDNSKHHTMALEDNPLGDKGMWATGDPDPDNKHEGWQDMFDEPVEESPSVYSGSNDSGNFYCPYCHRPYVNMTWDNIYKHGTDWHGMREDKARKMADDFTSEFMRDAFAEPFPEDRNPQPTSFEADGALPSEKSWYDVQNEDVDAGGIGDYGGAMGMDSMLGMNLNQWGYSKQECPNCGSTSWSPPPENADGSDWDLNTYRCNNCGTIYDDDNKVVDDQPSYTDSQGYTIKKTDPQIQRGRFSFDAGGVPDLVPDEAREDPRSFYESYLKEYEAIFSDD